jgi:protein involved in polysaccharide export with SLBB domain
MYFAMNKSFNKTFRVALGALAIAAIWCAGPVRTASAQMRHPELETRASLTEKAAREEQAGRRGSAALIRARLLEGDYRAGDRVVIFHENMPVAAGRGDPAVLSRPDTLIVRSGLVLQFPQAQYQGVKDLAIGGLLHSELPAKVQEAFEEVYRAPVVRVTSLINLTITGSIMRSGTIDVPPDLRINDVFTHAGGFTTDADIDKIFVRRGAQDFMTPKQLQEAISSSLTIDATNLRAGDQIIVPRKNPSNWLTYLGVGLSMLTLAVAVSRGQ